MGNWAESQFIGVGSDIQNYFGWMKKQVNEFRELNRLGNEHYWCYERAEPSIYIEKLHKLSALNRLLADMALVAVSELCENLQEVAHDLGAILEKNLEQ